MLLSLLSLAFFACASYGSIILPEGAHLESFHFEVEQAKLHERSDVVHVERADSESFHSLVFEVAPKNLHRLDDILLDVSDPSSINYGRHWSFEELKDFTFNAVSHKYLKTFFESNSIEVQKEVANGDYFIVNAKVSFWEEFLNTEFHRYCIKDESSITSTTQCTGKEVVRAARYSLPKYMKHHVSAVLRTVDFPMKSSIAPQFASVDIQPQPSSSSHLRSQGTIVPNYVYPELLNTVYNISSTVASNIVSQAIFGTLGQSVSPKDLKTFQQTFTLAQTPLAGNVNGHVSNSACSAAIDDCIEANLDVQYIMALAQNVPTTYYYWPDNTSFVDWTAWITSVADLPKPSDVYSISYGQLELGITVSIMNSFNLQAIKLAIMGVSIITSSGDSGAAGTTSTSYACKGYFPNFPASSQYVTSIGATMGPEVSLPEVACQQKSGKYPTVATITTGGGFSNMNAQPTWQRSIVQHYFQTVAGTSSQPKTSAQNNFNTTGRGYPDVSLLGHGYIIIANGTTIPVDGTSASAPAFAGLVSLANYHRKKAGKPVLGFLNPFLYASYPNWAKDISSGDSFCYSSSYNPKTGDYTANCCVNDGFFCASGWDPVTGLGSVNGGKFIAAAMSATSSITTVPTMAPTTVAPTAAPTLIPYVSFAASQVINGISLTTYMKNSTLYNTVLAQSISDCMSNITPDEVSQFVATAVTATVTITASKQRAATSSNAISLSYVVVDNEPTASYTMLTTQLQEAVSSGGFDAFLATNAQSQNAMALMGCTSTTVSTNQIGGSSSSDGSTETVKDGVIAGLVFGVFAAACLLGAMIYYCFYNK